MNETGVQVAIRLRASLLGARLWRNNVGALPDARGVPVRFGLANESKALNQKIKSGDLIGWEPVVITQEMVGTTIARFLSVECKRGGWRPTPGDKHEEAQRAWADLVNREGGRAIFATGPESL